MNFKIGFYANGELLSTSTVEGLEELRFAELEAEMRTMGNVSIVLLEPELVRLTGSRWEVRHKNQTFPVWQVAGQWVYQGRKYNHPAELMEAEFSNL